MKNLMCVHVEYSDFGEVESIGDSQLGDYLTDKMDLTCGERNSMLNGIPIVQHRIVNSRLGLDILYIKETWE